MFSQKSVYANGKGFQKGMQANGPIEDEKELMDLKARAAFAVSEMGYLVPTSGYKVVFDGQTKTNGKPVYQLTVTTPSGKVSTELYDVESGLKISELTTEGEGDQLVQINSTIESYKEVGGIRWPDATSVNAGGQKITTKLADVKLNKDVDSTLFAE
jgi:hypothetical protein